MGNAKKALGERCCISGNVPASLIATGSPREVKEYCRKTIETGREGGGFILAAGTNFIESAPSRTCAPWCRRPPSTACTRSSRARLRPGQSAETPRSPGRGPPGRQDIPAIDGIGAMQRVFRPGSLASREHRNPPRYGKDPLAPDNNERRQSMLNSHTAGTAANRLLLAALACGMTLSCTNALAPDQSTLARLIAAPIAAPPMRRAMATGIRSRCSPSLASGTTAR